LCSANGAFDDWEGPRFHLRTALPGKWAVTAADQTALVVGREDQLHIEGENSLCVERIEEQTATGSPIKLVWSRRSQTNWKWPCP